MTKKVPPPPCPPRATAEPTNPQGAIPENPDDD